MSERILVIEDDRNVLEMLTDMLTSVGYRVVGLGYPEVALEVVDHEHPDLILMDIMLPKRSGIEVADQLWVNGFGTTPIIGLSASSVMAELARHTPFFTAVVRKPFDMDELLGLLADTVRDHNPTGASRAATAG